MRAIQFHRYGRPEVLKLESAPQPRPGPGEVLVRVAAAAVNPKDCLVRKGKFAIATGHRFPLGVGYDFAGEVAELGAGVDDLREGQRVHGMLNGWRGRAYAEYLSCPAAELAPMPEALDSREAAAVPLAGQTALQALRDLGRVRSGDRVLINGASGGVGTFAVQVAKAMGAEVTAVCSAANADLVRGLGADHCHDYRESDPLDLEQRFDVWFDVFGNKSFPQARNALARRGVYITTVPAAASVAWHLGTRLSPGRRGLLVVVKSRRVDIEALTAWIEAGALRPVIARTYPLEWAADAHAYIETKRARGKVVLDV